MELNEQLLGDNSNNNVQVGRDLNINIKSDLCSSTNINIFNETTGKFYQSKNILDKLLGKLFINKYEKNSEIELDTFNFIEIDKIFNLPAKISCREKILLSLKEEIKPTKNIISIFGVKETGKTIFLKLMYNQYFKNKMCLYVPFTRNLDIISKNIINALKRYEIVIIDNLPSLTLIDESSLFISLLKEVLQVNKTIILTGSSQIPEKIKLLCDNKIVEFNLPPFSIEEITELFGINDLKYSESNKVLELIQALTEGHPALINSLIRNLINLDKKLDGNELLNLLSSDYKKSLQEEKLQIILKKEDQNTITLLTRLDFISYNFSLEELKLVSTVEPIIDNYLKIFTEIKNIWIKEENNNYYKLSPLIKGTLAKFIDSKVEKRIALSLANNILTKSKINEYEALKVIVYLLKAEDYERMGSFFARSLFSLRNSYKPEVKHSYMIAALWGNKSLPEELDLSHRIFIRLFQIEIKLQNKENTDYLLADLINLIESPKDINWLAVFGIISILNPYTFDYKLKLFTTCYLKLSTTSIEIEKQISLIASESKIIEQIKILHIQYFIYIEIKSLEDVKTYLNYLRNLASDDFDMFLEDVVSSAKTHPFNLFYLKFGTILNDSFYENKDWNKAIDYIDSLREILNQITNRYIKASIVSLKIEILIKHLKDYETANKLAADLFQNIPNDNYTKFAIFDIIANSYEYVKEYDKAISWYDKANSMVFYENFISSKTRSQINHSNCLYLSENKSVAYKVISNAFELSNKYSNELRLDEIIAIHGEYIIQHHFGNKENCFDLIEYIYSLIYKERDNLDVLSKKAFVLFAHVVGWVAFKLKQLSDGSEYFTPIPGHFVNNNKNEDLAKHFDNTGESKYYSGLSIFAEDIGKDKKAIEWDMKAYEVSKNKTEFNTFRVLIPNLIANKNFEEALKLFIIFKNYYEKKLSSFDSIWYLSFCIPVFLQANEKNVATDIFKDILRSVNRDENEKLFFELQQFIDTEDNEELIRISNDYNKRHEEFIAAFFIIKAASKKDLELNICRDYHNGIIDYLHNHYSLQSFIYRNNILPYFKMYWNEKFRRYSFFFRDKTFGEKLYALFESEDSEKLLKLKYLLSICI